MRPFHPLVPILLVAVAVLTVLLAAACGSDPTATPPHTATPVPPPTATPVPTATPAPTVEPTPDIVPTRETLIPEGASLVIDVQVGPVLDSQLVLTILGDLLKEDGPGSSVFDQFENDFGLDFDTIESVEAFLDLEDVLQAGSLDGGDEGFGTPMLGAVIRGEFDEGDFLARMESAAEQDIQVVQYLGNELFAGSGDDPDSLAFSFINSTTLLFGSIAGVKALIDVAEGAAPPISGDLIRVLDEMGERHIGVILSTPPEFFDVAMEGSEDGIAMLGMLDPTALTSPLTVTKVKFDDSAMELEVRQFFEEEADAIVSKEYTEGTMAMLGAFVGSPVIQEMVSNMEIKQSGLEVSSSLTITEDQLTGILEFLAGALMLQPAEDRN